VSVMASFLSFNSTQPSWSCFIDGNAFQNNLHPSNSSNLNICATNITTKATPSNLTVVASGTTDKPFLVDYIKYIPDASTVLDNATVIIKASDSQIQYDSSWNISGGQATTSVQGASLTFDFVGTFPQACSFKYFLSNLFHVVKVSK
jgi:hypothetical protein